MRKFLAMLALAGFVSVLAGGLAGDARARSGEAKWRSKQLFWEQYGPTAGQGNGTKVDTVFFDGATQTVDTTEAVSTEDWAFTQHNAPVVAASGIARVNIVCSGDGIDADSLFVAIDVGGSKNGPWQTGGTFVGGVGGTAGNDILSMLLLGDIDDNSGVTTASKLIGQPWVRFRVRVDGNTAAKWSGARFIVSYPTWQD